MQFDGYSLDDKRAETKDNDIPDIVNRYTNLEAETDRLRTDKSFFVPFADIKANDWDLSISKYKEVVYEEITYAKPAVIIQDIKTLQEENKAKLLILEDLLK
jgi:type I restriction enzyme M protein